MLNIYTWQLRVLLKGSVLIELAYIYVHTQLCNVFLVQLTHYLLNIVHLFNYFLTEYVTQSVYNFNMT